MKAIYILAIVLSICIHAGAEQITGLASGHWEAVSYVGNTAHAVGGSNLAYRLTFPPGLRPVDRAIVWPDAKYYFVMFLFKDSQQTELKAWIKKFGSQCPISRSSYSSIKAPVIVYNRFVPHRDVWYATGVVRTAKGSIGFDWLDSYMPKDIGKSPGYGQGDYALNQLLHGPESPIREQRRVIWLRCAFPRRLH